MFSRFGWHCFTEWRMGTLQMGFKSRRDTATGNNGQTEFPMIWPSSTAMMTVIFWDFLRDQAFFPLTEWDDSASRGTPDLTNFGSIFRGDFSKWCTMIKNYGKKGWIWSPVWLLISVNMWWNSCSEDFGFFQRKCGPNLWKRWWSIPGFHHQ